MLVLMAYVFLSFLLGTTQKNAGPPVSWQSRDPGHISVSEAVTARDCCLCQSVALWSPRGSPRKVFSESLGKHCSPLKAIRLRSNVAGCNFSFTESIRHHCLLIVFDIILVTRTVNIIRASPIRQVAQRGSVKEVNNSCQ